MPRAARRTAPWPPPGSVAGFVRSSEWTIAQPPHAGPARFLADAHQASILKPYQSAHIAAQSRWREQVGDLVGLDRVMEGGDVVAELLRHIDHVGHFVGAVAVVLDEDLPSSTPSSVSSSRSRSGMSAALGVIIVPLLLVGDGLRSRSSRGERDVAHSGRRESCPLCRRRVWDFRRMPSSTRRRARELHLLDGRAGNVFQNDGASTEQIGRSWKDLHVVTPPLTAPANPGSCGHTYVRPRRRRCSGSVASLPSEFASTPGEA